MRSKQTILLTGATGFLGCHLVEQMKSYNIIIVGNEDGILV